MNTAVVAITRHGIVMAGKVVAALPEATLFAPEKFCVEAEAAAPGLYQCYEGKTAEQIPALFAAFDAIVAIVSLGAVVRLIAPHLGNKENDPAVVVVDEAGKFAIPILSGHLGGANALAGQLALALGATPVLTTASDVGKTIPVDILGRELGWTVEAPKLNITRVSAAVVNEEPVAFVQEAGSPHWWTRPTPLPPNIHRHTRLEDVDLARYRAVLWITHRPVDDTLWQTLHERLVVYRPPLPAGNDATTEAAA